MSSVVLQVGAMTHLLVLSIARAVRRPQEYAPEFVSELRFALGIAWFPLALTSFALAFGPVGVQASGFLGLFGALDRMGSIYELAVVREFAPFVSAIVLASVVGTAICADLGAREVREETDALRVMGVDPVKSLIVPRLLTIVTLSVVFNIFALVSGLAGAVLVCVQNHAPIGPFFANFLANATTLELGASFVKAACYATIIAVVCCYKGTSVSGGAESVGRAVNQAVVISFLAIGIFDYGFTQLLLATHPILSETRG
jgi:phospholipid/cholesterol/gamma-HCH transport system permease protein